MSASAERDPEVQPATHREVEVKVRLAADTPLPALDGLAYGVSDVVVGAPTILVAAYYDTPDLRLLRWGVTLRRREGGTDEGWHLKLPTSADGALVRDELALPLDAGARADDAGAASGGAGVPDDVPRQLADVVRALVREAPLIHIATLRTHRAPCILLDDDGTETAEVVDDRVEVVRDDVVVGGFREVEVEAREGAGGRGRRALAAVAAALVASGGVPQRASKVASALAPDGVGAPDVVVPPQPRADRPAGEAVHHVLATNVRALLLADTAVRRDLPDSVHQLRVAVRTLRSTLRTFRPLFDGEWAAAARAELAWAADAMGTARDTEVFGMRLRAHADRLPPGERDLSIVEGWLHERLATARAAALEALRSDRYLRLLTDLVAAVAAPRLAPGTEAAGGAVFGDLAERASRRLVRAVGQLKPGSPPADWHHTRILAKRARYAAEAAVPLLGAPAQRRGTALARATDVLGDLHDAVVARDLLRELAARTDASGQVGYRLGLLDGIEAERAAADGATFAKVWPRIRRELERHPLRSTDPSANRKGDG